MINNFNKEFQKLRFVGIRYDAIARYARFTQGLIPRLTFSFKFMKKLSIESLNNKLTPDELGSKFNSMDFSDFVRYLRQIVKENPSDHFRIVADWTDANKTRAAKALLDQYASKLQIDSIVIKATRQQYQEDVNAFESGVEWQEI